jgi:hypothetical protein
MTRGLGMNNKLVRWLAYFGLSVVIAPIIVFNAGLLLVGEYEGENGLFGFLSTVYGAALSGSLSAWLLLLGPIIVVLIWMCVYWAWRSLAPAAASGT